MHIFRGVFFLLLLILLESCDAPRINPLDPENPDYNLSSIEGTVSSETGPPQPISNVKVSWKTSGSNIVVTTNSEGKFLIEELPRTTGWLVVEKDGYQKDSISKNLVIEKIVKKDFFLNSIPKLETYNIFTEVINDYPAVQKYGLSFSAKVTDLENDIDSVLVSSSEINYKRKLVYNITTKLYEYRESNLSAQFMDGAIGKAFEIVVHDTKGKIFLIGSSAIKRIITKEVEFVSPANKQVVETRPTLKWKRYDVGFNFKYKILIYTPESFPNIYLEKKNISKDDIELTLDSDLPAGDYFWVIWCVDDFLNSSRSKPANFTVK